MSSKKEEERIEKIIRGLMKLPPNRRCINCNSLGPQYVCTNFWTFVCTTCSGIHREFTHRVKSVSMAKFTFQEVEALQRGGNQRAREIYLKDWDPQQQRLPGSNNIDRVREFIKHVYVDRRYAGGKTSDKPPRDIQNPRNHEEDTRRASSYHSYSQSPPYEHQYEDRRYGKQAAVLTRRPGSDRGLYEGKVSSFVYSPGRLGEKMFEDSFANEGSVSRVSDYSVSTAGDPFRSGTQSPNLHQDISSPPVQTVRNVFSQSPSTYSEANARRDADGVALPQRTVSSGSIGSFVNNSMPLRSVKSGSLIDNVSEFGQSIGTQDIISSFPSLSRPSVSGDAVSLDLFNAPPALQPGTSSAPSINFFEPPVISSASSMDFFQTSSTSSDPSTDLFKPAMASASSIDFFAEISHQHSATTSVEQRPSAVSSLDNTGWATFDLHQHAAHVSDAKKVANVNLAPSDGPFVGKADPILSINTSMKWPPVQASSGPANMQSWNAFEDSIGSFSQISFENLSQTTEPQAPAHNPLPTSDKYISSAIAENSSQDGFQKASVENKPSVPSIPYNGVIAGSSFTSSVLPSVGGLQLHAFDWKSTNPFDLPYDSDLEPNNTFLDMNSLQAALPNSQLQPAFLGGLSQPLYPQNSVTPFISAAPQGGLPYITEQASSPQLPNNIPSQGSVASLGGNPFA